MDPGSRVFYVGSKVSGLTEWKKTAKNPRELICVKMFVMILDSVFRLWTCLFWIENRKTKSLAYTRRWVCQGTKIKKYNHNKKYIPYSFFILFYTFDCIFNLHSEIECLIIFLTGASEFIKNSTTVNYWRHLFNFWSSSTVLWQLFQLQNKHVHFPKIDSSVLCKITIDLSF